MLRMKPSIFRLTQQQNVECRITREDQSGECSSTGSQTILRQIVLARRGPAVPAVVAVVAAVVAPQQVLTLHLPLQTRYVPVAEVFTQLLNFF